MIYPSLEQRIAHMYLETLPPMYLAQGVEASAESQSRFYAFMKGMYQRLYDEPTLLYPALHKDDCFTNRYNRAQDGKPKLYGIMRGAMKKLEEYVLTLFTVGAGGELTGGGLLAAPDVKIAKRSRAALEACGIRFSEKEGRTLLSHGEYGDMFAAWKWLSFRQGATPIAFSRCQFDDSHSYMSDLFGILGGGAALAKLEAYFAANGYTRIDNREGQISLDYIKNHSSKEMPVKDAWGERTHSGIQIRYDPYVGHPLYYSLRVPMYRQVLERFGEMNAAAKALIAAKGKKCDGCRYCVQTDKTGKRPFASVKVEYGKPYALCSYFPGFYYTWEELSCELADGMIGCMDFFSESFTVRNRR